MRLAQVERYQSSSGTARLDWMHDVAPERTGQVGGDRALKTNAASIKPGLGAPHPPGRPLFWGWYPEPMASPPPPPPATSSIPICACGSRVCAQESAELALSSAYLSRGHTASPCGHWVHPVCWVKAVTLDARRRTITMPCGCPATPLSGKECAVFVVLLLLLIAVVLVVLCIEAGWMDPVGREGCWAA